MGFRGADRGSTGRIFTLLGPVYYSRIPVTSSSLSFSVYPSVLLTPTLTLCSVLSSKTSR